MAECMYVSSAPLQSSCSGHGVCVPLPLVVNSTCISGNSINFNYNPSDIYTGYCVCEQGWSGASDVANRNTSVWRRLYSASAIWIPLKFTFIGINTSIWGIIVSAIKVATDQQIGTDIGVTVCMVLYGFGWFFGCYQFLSGWIRMLTKPIIIRMFAAADKGSDKYGHMLFMRYIILFVYYCPRTRTQTAESYVRNLQHTFLVARIALSSATGLGVIQYVMILVSLIVQRSYVDTNSNAGGPYLYDPQTSPILYTHSQYQQIQKILITLYCIFIVSAAFICISLAILCTKLMAQVKLCADFEQSNTATTLSLPRTSIVNQPNKDNQHNKNNSNNYNHNKLTGSQKNKDNNNNTNNTMSYMSDVESKNYTVDHTTSGIPSPNHNNFVRSDTEKNVSKNHNNSNQYNTTNIHTITINPTPASAEPTTSTVAPTNTMANALRRVQLFRKVTISLGLNSSTSFIAVLAWEWLRVQTSYIIPLIVLPGAAGIYAAIYMIHHT